MISKVAYVDEFGNNSFKFDSQGSHFIVASIICKPDKVNDLEKSIDEIRKKHGFQTGEIKSSKVSKNHKRRIRILEDIVKLDFSIYAVIIDKRELIGQGFKYKKSFYKYLNNLLYKELFRTFPELDLYVDEHGGNDYMLEFKKYVHKHHTKNLFSGSDFDIKNSKNEKLIQLADFIAGTLGFIFDITKASKYSDEFKKIIEPKLSDLNFFPKKYSFEEVKQANTDNEFDPLIAKVSLQRINSFLDNCLGDEQYKVDQINFLKLLLLFQRVYYKSKFVLTDEIFKHLNQSRDSDLKKEYFRTKVVGNLRDQGVLISSSRSGYKIPTTRKDLESFVSHGNGIILPMLNRINEMRKAIKLASGKELDILENFDELKDIIDKNK
ncbi:DUF3800 domain-containing protein [Zunongwangia sp. HRR-M8]|uniref:DUF3800 domain-containing protein n=1 Tax=Zunongwangia sp. HRR-M8 TaxID=3015170 RepID=UPI0022DE4F96|nr:DUF3800 domain-containing protein [Zunongwangia sp. HRR-M8]WBL23731.1 DUF3800 domain-containing protein [Zunongwangia sp. HRR-M8]